MAQTILSGFDDVWVSAENYNTVKGTTNPSIYGVVQFVIRRTSDQKLFFGYKVNSKQAGTIAVSVTRNQAGSAGYLEAKDNSSNLVGSSTGYDSDLSKYYQVSGTSTIMVYPADGYPGVKTTRYYGEYNGTKLYVTIQYGTDSYLFGDFETTTTDVSQYLNAKPSIVLTSPTNNQVVSSVSGRRTITISGTVADANSNTVTISATINGKTKTTAVAATPTAKSWGLSWDVVTDAIAQGSYSGILVTSDDGNGGISTATYTGTITVDKTNPVITINGVANGSLYQNSVVPTFSATDAGGSSVSSVTATLNGSAYTSGTPITKAGSNTLVVTAIDGAGNQSQQTVTFIINKAPALSLISPPDNLFGIDGNCEDASKFAFTAGTAALDSTRKTTGSNSIKITKTADSTYVDPKKRIYPSVGEYYLAIADVYLENVASQVFISALTNGVTRSLKQVTSSAINSYAATNPGQFVPVITAFRIDAVTTPGTSDAYPRLYHVGTNGHNYNVDSFRLFLITQAQYDALGTNVNLATAKSIAMNYPYIDPANNQTLAEGNALAIQGTATDPDANDSVTVKCRINNGTIRNIGNGISDGSSAISFARNLIFSGDRLYDGTTDVSGPLAEGVQHKIEVWAEDGNGGSSAIALRSFTVHHNDGPTITVDPFTPTQNGLIEPDTLSLSGSASDPDGNTVTVTGKMNNGPEQTLLSGVSSGNWTFTFPVSAMQTGANTVTITATDQFGAKNMKTFSLNKTDQRTPLTTGVARYKVLPPLGSAKEILAWLKREIGDLSVDTSVSFADPGQPESYISATKKSVDLTTLIAEDEFIATVASPKQDIVFKQTFTRTDANSPESATSLVGVME